MWGDMADLAKTNNDGFEIPKSRKRRPTAEEEQKANDINGAEKDKQVEVILRW